MRRAIYGAAVLAGLLTTSSFVWLRMGTKDASQVVLAAYKDSRPIDLRIDGVSYTPLGITTRAHSDWRGDPASLREAKTVIAKLTAREKLTAADLALVG